MKIKLVFDDWRTCGKSVYNTEEGVELSSGDFHSGTTFEGEIVLDAEQEEELKKRLGDRYQPVFWVCSTEAEQKQEKVVTMALCEVLHVCLRPNQLYKFVVMPGCDACKEADAYLGENEEV